MVLQKGYTYGTYTLRLKAVNCDVTFTPRTAQPGQTLSAGAKIYSNQEIYIRREHCRKGYHAGRPGCIDQFQAIRRFVENKDESLKQDARATS